MKNVALIFFFSPATAIQAASAVMIWICWQQECMAAAITALSEANGWLYGYIIPYFCDWEDATLFR